MPLGSIASDKQDVLPHWLRERLRARVEGEIRLPVLPDTACRVIAACRDEHSDLRALAELVTHDQALAAHVLRVANSVAFAPKAPIEDLRQALSRLGLSTVSDITLALAIKQRAFSVPGHESRIRELWLHSAATACYAQEVAQVSHGKRDSAFLLGLLHDVGMPITMQIVCDIVRERATDPVPQATMEQAMSEFHCELGARLAQSWRLGPQVSSAIRYHHDPAAAKPLASVIEVVALADELAYWALDESRTEEDFTAGRELAVAQESLPALLNLRAHVLELSRAFL